MEDTERQKFEETWRGAFEGAGVQPSENLWNGIEQSLDNAERGAMRRRVIYYQRLAAACVLFSLLAGAYGLYWRNEHYTQLAKVNPSTGGNENKSTDQNQLKPIASSPDSATSTQTRNSIVKTQNNIAGLKINSSASNSKEMKNRLSGNENSVEETKSSDVNSSFGKTTDTFLVENEKSIGATRSVTKENRYSYAYVSDVTEKAPMMEIDLKGGPQNVELARKLPSMPAVFMDQSKNKKYEEKWWAAAGASAGSYSPNFNSSSSPTMTNSYQTGALAIPSSMPANYGTSYSVALTAAHRVSRRWVLQSGMQYMARSIDYTSNFVNNTGAKSAASLADYATLSSNTVAVASPYQLESKSEYISIPLQAGYLLVDRKFGLLINSGVSSDIFIRNTLTDLSGQRSSYSESAGQNSPYRTFMWSALMSTEFSYKMGSHYRLALVPGMRYSLNQVLKSDQSMQGNPMIWDVGFRFRYIFK